MVSIEKQIASLRLSAHDNDVEEVLVCRSIEHYGLASVPEWLASAHENYRHLGKLLWVLNGTSRKYAERRWGNVEV
jgi:hypothetical protein